VQMVNRTISTCEISFLLWLFEYLEIIDVGEI